MSMAQLNANRSLLVGVVAGFGASVCCVGPLVLLALGMSGAWIGNLTALEPFRPYLIQLRQENRYGAVRPAENQPCRVGQSDDGCRFPLHASRWLGQTVSAAVMVMYSVLTCPRCGVPKSETMPVDACQFFYECSHCKELLRPLPGDCCVFCSYGSVKCPPIQADHPCCG